MLKTLLQLFALFDTRERWRLLGLTFCMLVMAVLEMIGVASIMPFMQMISNPDLIHENRWLSEAYLRLDFSSPDSFILFMGIMLLVLIGINNGFSAFTMWLMFRFAAVQNHRLCMRLLAGYLTRPYIFYLHRNTADLNRNILTEVNTVIRGVLLSVLRLMARGLVAVLIIGMLAAIDASLAITVGVVLGGAYSIVYLLLRRRQRRLGEERLAENGRRFRTSGEALSGIKEVKVLGRESAFLMRFRDPSWRFNLATASNQVVSSLPRYAFETIAFSGILLVALNTVRGPGNVEHILPMLSLYAFAGYRLLPALNEIFTSIVQLRFNRAALDDLHRDLMEDRGEESGKALAEVSTQWRSQARHHLGRSITLKNVSFTYPETTVPSLENIDLSIERQQIIGLVGETGAGKTTLVDLILGLLQPTEGVMEIDGEPLNTSQRIRSWRSSCGYVPQEIFLLDDSVRANIAFGIPTKAVQEEEVVRSARTAQIDDFVRSLPEGYDTIVGERGVRLSGGQRQRIGIARALYQDPDVLVMDEGTSSLDGATEAAVMEMIHQLGGRKSVIVIAHRLTTVSSCDVIHVMQDGRIIASGTYDQLARTNTQFRVMAGLEATAAT